MEKTRLWGMNKTMKDNRCLFSKTVLLAFLLPLLLIGATPVFPDAIKLSNYHIAPMGAYDRVILVPRTAIPGTSCALGTLYVNTNANKTLYYCGDDSVDGEWMPITDTWTSNGNNIYPTNFDPANPFNPNLLVGIGTQSPEFRLTLDNDGGLIAKGDYSTGTTLATQGAGTRLIW